MRTSILQNNNKKKTHKIFGFIRFFYVKIGSKNEIHVCVTTLVLVACIVFQQCFMLVLMTKMVHMSYEINKYICLKLVKLTLYINKTLKFCYKILLRVY